MEGICRCLRNSERMTLALTQRKPASLPTPTRSIPVPAAVVKDGGWRKERRGSPLLNILRQRADALAQPLIWVDLVGHKRPALLEDRTGTTPPTMVNADLSPMRTADPAELAALQERCLRVAQSFEDAAFSLPLPTFDGLSTPSAEEFATLPIWKLPACTIQFAMTGRSCAHVQAREGEPPADAAALAKLGKKLAAALAAELGTAEAEGQWGGVERPRKARARRRGAQEQEDDEF